MVKLSPRSALGPLRRVPFIVWLWIAQLFLLINAPAISSPADVEKFRTIIITYMIAQLMFMSVLPIIKGIKFNLNMAIAWFVGGFVVTLLVVTGFQFLKNGLQMQTYSVSAAMYAIVLHAVVVAVSEELVFRGELPAIISVIPAQVLFGLFHYSAYGGNPLSILIAIIAGFVFYGVMKFTNIWTAMGAHAAWNVAILQIFGVLH
jgi:membrane protease YdiL (CAAX protease family)